MNSLWIYNLLTKDNFKNFGMFLKKLKLMKLILQILKIMLFKINHKIRLKLIFKELAIC